MTPDRLLELFAGRDDTFAIQRKDGVWNRTANPLTTAEAQAHLDGSLTVGRYVLRADARVRFGCADVDHPGWTDLRALKPDDRDGVWRVLAREWEDLGRLFEAARVLGVREDALLQEYTGGRGFHLWVLFAEWVPAADVVRLMGAIVAHAKCASTVEIFPKQTSLAGEDKFGNLIRLPLGVHRVTGRRSEVLSPPGRVEPLSLDELNELLAPMPPVLPSPTGGGPAPEAKIRPPHRHPTLIKLAASFLGKGLPAEAVNDALLAYDAANCEPPLQSEPDGLREIADMARWKPPSPPTAILVPRGHEAAPVRPDRVRKVQGEGEVRTFLVNWPGFGDLALKPTELFHWGGRATKVRDRFVATFGRYPPWVPRTAAEWAETLDPLLERAEIIELAPEETAVGELRDFVRYVGRRVAKPESMFSAAKEFVVIHDAVRGYYLARRGKIRALISECRGTIFPATITDGAVFEGLQLKLGISVDRYNFPAELLHEMEERYRDDIVNGTLQIPRSMRLLAFPEAMVEGEDE